MSDLKVLLSTLAAAWPRPGGYPLDVNVRYSLNDHVFREQAPAGAAAVTDLGLADPGFGSGPVSFDEIDEVEVLARPRHATVQGEYLESYCQTFDWVAGRVTSLDEVNVSESHIRWIRKQTGL